MSALGAVFLLVVLAEPRARPGGTLAQVLTGLSWGLWAVFALEYATRLAIATDRLRFLRRTWWQLLFLALPFLRLLRLVRLFRLLRTGRVLSSAVRSSRSASSVLSGRLGWLASVTVITVLAASQLVYEFGEARPYGQALYVTALAVIAGETFGASSGFGRVLETVLVTFSVGIFATLAGSLGAYFLRSPADPEQPLTASPESGEGTHAAQLRDPVDGNRRRRPART